LVFGLKLVYMKIGREEKYETAFSLEKRAGHGRKRKQILLMY
jgi:hypothetical protein